MRNWYVKAVLIIVMVCALLGIMWLFSYSWTNLFTDLSDGVISAFAFTMTVMENAMSIALPLLGILLVLPFTFYLLAEKNLFFTKLETGDIKFVVRGDSLVKIIHDVGGKKLETDEFGDQQFVDGIERKTFLNTRFGLWWVGIPPFARVHTFMIKKERENPGATDSEHWINADTKLAEVSSLRFTFPRPYKLDKVELADRLAVNLLAVAKFEVVRPHIPVFLFKGAFFVNAGSILRAHIADLINNRNLNEFILAPKGEVGGILESMKKSENETADDPNNPGHKLGDFNRELIRQVGLRLVGISITQYDPSDADIRAAMQAEELAIKQGLGRIAKAKADATVTTTDAEAKATAEERLARARGARVRETVAALASTLGSPDVVAVQAGKVLHGEALKDTKITSWVEGGANVQPILNIGGDKK